MSNLRCARVRENDLRQGEGMDGADEHTVTPLHTERVQPDLQLPRAFVVVGDASHAPWLPHVLRQDARHLDRERLGLAAAGPGDNDAVTGRVVRGPLARVTAQMLGRAEIQRWFRHEPSRM